MGRTTKIKTSRTERWINDAGQSSTFDVVVHLPVEFETDQYVKVSYRVMTELLKQRGFEKVEDHND